MTVFVGKTVLDSISGHLGKIICQINLLILWDQLLFWSDMKYLVIFVKCLTINILRKTAIIILHCARRLSRWNFRLNIQSSFSALLFSSSTCSPSLSSEWKYLLWLLHFSKEKEKKRTEIVRKSERERERDGNLSSWESSAWPKPATRLIDSLRSETLSRLLPQHNLTSDPCTCHTH